MKIWLNDKKVKESEFAIPCHCCIFNRSVPYNYFVGRCLLRTFNLRTSHDWCFRGYFYEDMEK